MRIAKKPVQQKHRLLVYQLGGVTAVLLGALLGPTSKASEAQRAQKRQAPAEEPRARTGTDGVAEVFHKDESGFGDQLPTRPTALPKRGEGSLFSTRGTHAKPNLQEPSRDSHGS